ncbi:MAG TPA: PIG-L family deacetylase [Pyrinomonadaceae bacterium]|nr:PIG-L family deacetylase [Pyrinomonadaceae bacterium]
MKNHLLRRFASRIVILTLFAAAAFPSFPISHGQEPAPSPTTTTNATVDKAELQQALVDLTNTATVMCVAAHPDDEDGTTLTVLRRRDGAHTVSLFSTYGEGGQNAVGPELYEELGVIREQETRNAAAIQGSEPFFLGLKDFGFSKSADEAFKFWGHDEALRRMVLKIRELRPNVIITNHDTTSGHGHHQATGRLIIEAFDAAADPKRFPEQLNQLTPWQAERLFVRVFGANAKVEATDKIFAIDPNEIDPVRGTSYAEQALTALQQHATQGPWPKSMAEMLRMRRVEAGKLPLTRYRLIREAAGTPPFPPSAATPLAGLELSAKLAARLAPPQIEGKPLTEFLDRPDRVLGALVDWQAAFDLVPNHETAEVQSEPKVMALSAKDGTRVLLFAHRMDRALAVASGVSLSLKSKSAVLVPNVSTSFAIVLANGGLSNVKIHELRFQGWGEGTKIPAAEELLPNTETELVVDRTTPATAKFSVPREEHLYDALREQTFQAVAQVEMDGVRFFVEARLQRDIAPAVEILHVSPATYVWTPGTKNQPISLTATLKNNLDSTFAGNLTIGNRRGHHFEAGRKLTLAPSETREVVLKSSAMPADTPAPSKRSRPTPGELSIAVEPADARSEITERSVPVVYADARVAKDLHVGYVPSFDSTLAHSLAALGVDAQALSVADVQSGNLSNYQTIIIDNRGYEARHELIAANPKLLEFVNNGGTLLVFYHKDNEWNPDEKKNRPQLAPYPIVLDDKRVTDETAPITFLEPKHQLLTAPNAITQADFANWIQERGLYYPRQWDPKYAALFATNDPGEAPLTGGLLVAQYGKGNYIYTSMVWYRELRAGLPGAYRMFANMISYPRK